MLNAGIQNGSALNAVHLWPGRKNDPVTLNTEAAKSKFKGGQVFYGIMNNAVTIHDLPPGTVVKIHPQPGCKITLLVN